eukprot:CAMPEP_0168316152 /NCGR_PEP_ID=MMETSP0210-20121227/14632_1 /TAXON_ID=40633 /ORGANISM="Condylostoma magnum, Strain COL2" /LENGTH=62 /DNA_ID=CAMNT_0008295377 /DNA_START=302 /DNA_END=490 /DNA_ORIENTATION=-
MTQEELEDIKSFYKFEGEDSVLDDVDEILDKLVTGIVFMGINSGGLAIGGVYGCLKAGTNAE